MLFPPCIPLIVIWTVTILIIIWTVKSYVLVQVGDGISLPHVDGVSKKSKRIHIKKEMEKLWLKKNKKKKTHTHTHRSCCLPMELSTIIGQSKILKAQRYAKCYNTASFARFTTINWGWRWKSFALDKTAWQKSKGTV